MPPIVNILFYFLSSLAIVAAVMVVVARNPVKAVLFLILTFFCTAGIWLLLEIEFLAITLVLVYVGAVMVLFLFVVMMLDIEISFQKEGFTRYLPLGVCVTALLLILLAYGLEPQHLGYHELVNFTPQKSQASNTVLLGSAIFNNYLLPFEIAGILLLVAIVVAIVLTFRGSQNSKNQVISKQVMVRAADRIKLLRGN